MVVEFKAGRKEAAKMLSGLDRENRQRVLENISKNDPDLGEWLKNNIVEFEDLRHMTTNMLAEFIREIKIDDLGLALRISTKELQSFFLNNLSRGSKRDIQDILEGPPQPKKKVDEAKENIMEIVRSKVEKGELVLKEGGKDEYV